LGRPVPHPFPNSVPATKVAFWYPLCVESTVKVQPFPRGLLFVTSRPEHAQEASPDTKGETQLGRTFVSPTGVDTVKSLCARICGLHVGAVAFVWMGG
jgi:hypothetical protein